MAAAGVIAGAIGEESMDAAGSAITAALITVVAITGAMGVSTAGADGVAIIRAASDATMDAGEILMISDII